MHAGSERLSLTRGEKDGHRGSVSPRGVAVRSPHPTLPNATHSLGGTHAEPPPQHTKHTFPRLRARTSAEKPLGGPGSGGRAVPEWRMTPGGHRRGDTDGPPAVPGGWGGEGGGRPQNSFSPKHRSFGDAQTFRAAAALLITQEEADEINGSGAEEGGGGPGPGGWKRGERVWSPGAAPGTGGGGGFVCRAQHWGMIFFLLVLAG